MNRPHNRALTLTIVSLGIAVLAAFPAQGAVPNFFGLLCNKNANGIIGAVCDLKKRVDALEQRSQIPGPQGSKGDKGDPGPQGI